MLNKLWGFFIFLAISFGFISGKLEQVNTAFLNSIKDTINFIIVLAGNMCFWCGIIKIVENTSIIKYIKKIILPIIKIIFPEVDSESDIFENISMNMVANLIGLGNASTPIGLRTMEQLQNKNINKSKLSDTQLKFILINTASIQIIPTTIISIRNSLGAKKTSEIIFGVWISTAITFISIIFISRVYIRYLRK